MRCSTCLEEKPLSDFYKHRQTKTGYESRCKSCQKKHRQSSPAYKANQKRYKIKAADKIAAYKEANKEKIKEYHLLYATTHKIQIQASLRRSAAKRWETSPQYRIRSMMSSGIRSALKKRGTSKANRTWTRLVDYTLTELCEHLERYFTSDMTWENYGSYWHIDHIRPQSWFRYETTDDPEFKLCWALSNLQPLEARINMSKGNRREGK